MQISWQDDAIADLIQIRRYISRDNPTAAAKVASRIREDVPLLAQQPAMGRPGRILGTREWVIKGLPYLIAYRVEENSLVILRGLHSARKWPEKVN